MAYQITKEEFAKLFEKFKGNRAHIAAYLGVSRTSVATWATKFGFAKGKPGRIYDN